MGLCSIDTKGSEKIDVSTKEYAADDAGPDSFSYVILSRCRGCLATAGRCWKIIGDQLSQ